MQRVMLSCRSAGQPVRCVSKYTPVMYLQHASLKIFMLLVITDSTSPKSYSLLLPCHHALPPMQCRFRQPLQQTLWICQGSPVPQLSAATPCSSKGLTNAGSKLLSLWRTALLHGCSC